MYEDYLSSTDEELIDRIRQGEKQITDYIMDKYKNLVRKKAQSMYILGADSDDLIQEGMIGLFKAVRDYDAGRDASFYTFADLCISRQMYTAVQASRREKHAPLNSYISLYANKAENGQEENDGADVALLNRLTSGTDNNPEALLIDKENVSDIEAAIEKELSPFEKQVLDLYLTGMSYSQIARVLGREDKSTDNALQRLKAKIRKNMQKSRMLLLTFMLCLTWQSRAYAFEAGVLDYGQLEESEEAQTQTDTHSEETQAVLENMTQVTVAAAPMTIAVPDDCYILQQEIAEDDAYLEQVGGDREKIEAYYKEAGIVLNAIAMDDSYEIVVTVNENQDLTYLYSMYSVSEESISELAQTIQSTYTELGYTVDDYTLYENDSAKYIVFSFGQEYEQQAVQCRQYDTIRDSRMYSITLRSYTGEVSEAMSVMLQGVIDSIEYTQSEADLSYESAEWGISFWLNSGWREITAENDEDIQAQYMHTNGLGESIQFIARDLWGDMDVLHQLTSTRAELDSDRELTDAQCRALYPYISDFFAGRDTIKQQKIQEHWYFVSDTPLAYTSEKLQGTYEQQTAAILKNGVLYVWQYGAYEDGSIHEGDFEELLADMTYTAPALLEKDASIYQGMVRRIPLLIFGFAMVAALLVAVLFLYDRSSREIKK